MEDYGNEAILNETNVEKLKELLSFNEVHACQIIASFELGRRFFSDSISAILRISFHFGVISALLRYIPLGEPS